MKIHTSWVLPVSGPPIRDGWVDIQDGRIKDLGRGGDWDKDLGPGVLLPGFVNAHTHIELSHLKGKVASEGGFVPWVRDLVGHRGEAPEAIREAAREAIDALAAGGTTAVGDVSNTLVHLDLLAASPLRAVVFYELLAWDPDEADEVLRKALERLASLAGGRVTVRLAAHAPHSVSPALFAGLSRSGGIASLHLAESREEVRFLSSGDGPWRDFLEERGLGKVAFEPPRVSPVQHVQRLGVLRPGLLVAHCVQTSASDRAILREWGCRVVVCPRSNRRLGVGRPPLTELLEAGIPVCVGTDSLASADSLDVWDDLLVLRQEFPEVPPSTLLRMATAEGAEALGLTDLGTLERGKAAAFAFVRHEVPPEDPYEALFAARPRKLVP